MKFPAPGRMIDIGGRRLHINVSGESRGQTVVLEAGLAATSLSWATVQPLIARFAKVASYDRAGFGWSGDIANPTTAVNAANDLHALLERAELPAPYILVGHSFGGLIVRIFQQQWPQKVAGLVLAEPVVRAEWRAPAPQQLQRLKLGVMLSRRGAFLARIGVVRFALKLLTGGARRIPQMVARASAGQAAGVASRLVGEIRKIPSELWPVIAAHWSEARSFSTMAEYLENLTLSVTELDEARTLGDLPISVLSAANASAEALAEHEHDAQISARGTHLIARNSGHWILLDAPDLIAREVERMAVAGANVIA
jgi:pimeloyl-ACP methyl ester carboxylesterase